MMSATDITSAVIQWTIFCLGVPGNLLIIGVYGRKKPWKSTDVLIMIQALVDLIACVCPPPVAVGKVITSYSLCWFLMVLRQSCLLLTLLLMALIAVDRYLIICKQVRRCSTELIISLIALGYIVFAIGIFFCLYT